jgi:hypothetical protein
MSVYITLAEAKAQCRVDYTDDDVYIQYLCDLVEEIVYDEIKGTKTGIGTVTTNGTVNLVGVSTSFTDYVIGHAIKLPDETVRTIATITDDTHLTVTVAFTTSASGLEFTVNIGFPNPLPLKLKHAMLVKIADFYMIRESIIIGTSASEIVQTYRNLVGPEKNWTFV